MKGRQEYLPVLRVKRLPDSACLLIVCPKGHHIAIQAGSIRKDRMGECHLPRFTHPTRDVVQGTCGKAHRGKRCLCHSKSACEQDICQSHILRRPFLLPEVGGGTGGYQESIADGGVCGIGFRQGPRCIICFTTESLQPCLSVIVVCYAHPENYPPFLS